LLFFLDPFSPGASSSKKNVACFFFVTGWAEVVLLAADFSAVVGGTDLNMVSIVAGGTCFAKDSVLDPAPLSISISEVIKASASIILGNLIVDRDISFDNGILESSALSDSLLPEG
jgi:hypothetical protein